MIYITIPVTTVTITPTGAISGVYNVNGKHIFVLQIPVVLLLQWYTYYYLNHSTSDNNANNSSWWQQCGRYYRRRDTDIYMYYTFSRHLPGYSGILEDRRWPIKQHHNHHNNMETSLYHIVVWCIQGEMLITTKLSPMKLLILRGDWRLNQTHYI
jgi:hypothetical protein